MKTYFHINNDCTCDWKEGDIIDFDGNQNYYWQGLSRKGDYIKLSGQEYPSNLVAEKALKVYKREEGPPKEMKDYHFHPLITLEQTFQSLGNSLRLNRELIFEYVRNEFYPELPSRHSCIWLIPNDTESVDFWKQIIQGNTHKIFKVTVDGKIHRASQKWLIGGTISVHEWEKLAHRYWQGLESGSLQDEILFEGKMKILKDLTTL